MYIARNMRTFFAAACAAALVTACGSGMADDGDLSPGPPEMGTGEGLGGAQGVGEDPNADDGMIPGDDSPDANNEEPADSDTSDTEDAQGSADSADCWVELFDGDNFDENDDHFTLTVPGDYPDLSDLPGAEKDWTDEADSIKVGPAATVTVWSQSGLAGDQQSLDSGSEHADTDDIYSLTLSCS